MPLTLPACGEEWNAPNAQEWVRIRRYHTHDTRKFPQVLGQLLKRCQIHRLSAISPFANYILTHGVFQETFFARNTTFLVEPSGSLQITFVQAMETALSSWQNSWEATSESTLDPLSLKGPMGFDASALLRLAYIRLNSNTGPHRQLDTRRPLDIANALTNGKIAVCKRLNGIHLLSNMDLLDCWLAWSSRGNSKWDRNE